MESVVAEKAGFQTRLPLTSYVNLDTLLNLSQFPFL